MGQDTRRLITDGWGQHQIVALDLVADYWYDTSLAAMLHYRQSGISRTSCCNPCTTSSEALVEKAYSCRNTVTCQGSGQLHLVQLNLQDLCICSIAPSWSRSHTAMRSHHAVGDVHHDEWCVCSGLKSASLYTRACTHT